jgi:hypothetical protein
VSTPRVTVSLEPESAESVKSTPLRPLILWFHRTPSKVQETSPEVITSPVTGLEGKLIAT